MMAVPILGLVPITPAIAPLTGNEDAVAPGFGAMFAAAAPRLAVAVSALPTSVGAVPGEIPPARWHASPVDGPLPAAVPAASPIATPALASVAVAAASTVEPVPPNDPPDVATPGQNRAAAFPLPVSADTPPSLTALEAAVFAGDRRADVPDATPEPRIAPDSGMAGADFATVAVQPLLPMVPAPPPVACDRSDTTPHPAGFDAAEAVRTALKGPASVLTAEPRNRQNGQGSADALPENPVMILNPVPPFSLAEAPQPTAALPPAPVARPRISLSSSSAKADLGRPAPAAPAPGSAIPGEIAVATSASARPRGPVDPLPPIRLASSVQAMALAPPALTGIAVAVAPAEPLGAVETLPPSLPPVVPVSQPRPVPQRQPEQLLRTASSAPPAAHAPPAAPLPIVASAVAALPRRNEPRDLRLTAPLDRDDVGSLSAAAPAFSLARPAAPNPTAPVDGPAAIPATAPPAAPIDIALSSSRLGDVRIGVDGAADDLRVSIGLSPAAAAIVAADTPRLFADLAATGIRLQTLDLSGAGYQPQGFSGSGTGQSPPQHSAHGQQGQAFQPAARPPPAARPEPAHTRASDRYA